MRGTGKLGPRREGQRLPAGRPCLPLRGPPVTQGASPSHRAPAPRERSSPLLDDEGAGPREGMTLPRSRVGEGLGRDSPRGPGSACPGCLPGSPLPTSRGFCPPQLPLPAGCPQAGVQSRGPGEAGIHSPTAWPSLAHPQQPVFLPRWPGLEPLSPCTSSPCPDPEMLPSSRWAPGPSQAQAPPFSLTQPGAEAQGLWASSPPPHPVMGPDCSLPTGWPEGVAYGPSVRSGSPLRSQAGLPGHLQTISWLALASPPGLGALLGLCRAQGGGGLNWPSSRLLGSPGTGRELKGHGIWSEELALFSCGIPDWCPHVSGPPFPGVEKGPEDPHTI